MDTNKIDFDYCAFTCPHGKQKVQEFLDQQNSAYDAALDMQWYVCKCAETCKRYQDGNKT